MATASKCYNIHMTIMECCLPDEVSCEGMSSAYLYPDRIGTFRVCCCINQSAPTCNGVLSRPAKVVW